MRNCWRFLVLALVAFLLTFALAAQTAAPAVVAPAAPATPANAGFSPVFSITLGTGHIWTGSGNYAYNLDSSEWQVHAAVTMFLTPHHGLMLAAGRDGATLIEYLHTHNYTVLEPRPLTYRYTVVDLAYRYSSNPGDKANVFVYAGPSGYFAGEDHKFGLVAGAGLEYGFTDHWALSATLAFRHVSNFLKIDQANFGETRLGLVYRF